MAALKYVFLLFPVLLVSSQSVHLAWSIRRPSVEPYRFISLVLLAVGRGARVWLYWVGMVRVAASWWAGPSVSRGWAVRPVGPPPGHVGTPVAMSRCWCAATSSRCAVACVDVLLWCIFEAAVFTYTLEPRITTLVNDLSGSDDARFTVPILYVMILALVMASFACVQALINAVRTKDPRFIAQISGIELFTIFFEVMFLYRGVVEVTMPWIAKDIGAMVATAAVGWFGVRGLTWFLFGQYGTPPLLALIARRPLTDADAPQASSMRSEPFWRLALDDFRRDLDWLHIKSDEMLELLALPVVHLLGAALNFAMILTASRPVFNLPFRSLKEVTESRDMETTMHLEPRKQVSL
jgi:hypothetical protein